LPCGFPAHWCRPVIAIGDDRKYVAALLTLDPDACTAYAKQYGLSDTSPDVLADDPDVRSVLNKGVAAANDRLPRVEQIKKFTVVPVTWEPGGDELTPKCR
jgi:long-subunit acyl-CoA synthetase (AMP-forming)